jgi:hypothetical protein
MTATELRQIQRLCQQIQTEKDSGKFTTVAMERYALLGRDDCDALGRSALKGKGNHNANGHNPYVRRGRARWLTDLLGPPLPRRVRISDMCNFSIHPRAG